MDDRDVVSAVQTALADKVGKHRYELWFGPPARMALVEGALHVEQASHFALDFVRTNFSAELSEIARAILGHARPVEYRVCALTAPSAKPLGASAASRPAAAETNGGASPPSAWPQRKFATFDSLVEGASNRVALAAARMVVERPDCFSCLFLHGPAGVGKTHLLEAIWCANRQRNSSLRGIHLSAEQFTTYYVQAVGGSGLPNFRRKYRGVGLLLIDDIQFFAGKKATLVELLHTVDTLLREGQRVVFAADRSLAELKFLPAELATRIAGGVAARIAPPEFAIRVEILRRKARELSLGVPEEVLTLIARRLPSTARELCGALHRLMAESQAHGQPISIDFAQRTLGDLFRDAAQPMRLADIQRAVCHVFGLEPDSLQSKKKQKAISGPRMLAMWLARKYTRAALSEIGGFFGGRTHATVISAQKKVDGWVCSGATVTVADAECPADEAIRRVEEILRVRVG
jgi:chromosomal replication initiator protein